MSTLKSRKQQTGWIGIDIGTSLIKIAQIERTGASWNLVSQNIIPVKINLSGNGQDHIRESLKSALQSSVSKASCFRGRRAACVLSMSVTEPSIFELPRGSEEEMREMLVQELSAELNHSVDNIVFDYWECDSLKQGDQSPTCQVSVLHTPQQYVDDVASEVYRAGAKCQTIDGLPQALARAVTLVTDDQSVNPQAALDWGFSNATFTIADKGVPLFTRILRDCGLSRLLDSISEGLGLTHSECRHLLTTYGVPDTNQHSESYDQLQSTILEFISPQIDQTIQEITKTLDYVKHQQAEISPAEIFLFGGGATTRNISGLLSSKLKVPVETWSPKNNSLNNFQANELTPLLGTAMALSLLGIK